MHIDLKIRKGVQHTCSTTPLNFSVHEEGEKRIHTTHAAEM